MTLHTRDAGDIAVLTIDRTEHRNALDLGLIDALDGALAARSEGDVPAAVVIAADGPTFSAGVDMSIFASYANGELDVIEGFIDRSAALIERLTAMPCLTVAAIQGMAAGPGMALTMACDLRVVADDAKFLSGFFRFGATPDGGVSAMLVRALGLSRAISTAITDRPILAPELVQLGLAERSVPATELVDAAVKLAGSVGRRPPKSWPRLRNVLGSASTNQLQSQLDLEREYAKQLINEEEFRRTITSLVKR